MTGKEEKIETVSKKPYWLTFCLIGLTLPCIFFLYLVFWNDNQHNWIIDALGIFGTFLSFAGVILALYQIAQANRQLKNMITITEATEKAVKDNRDEIRTLISYADVAHLCEIIQNVEDHLCLNQIQLVLHQSRHIKTELIRIESQLSEEMDERKNKLNEIILTMGIDIQSMADHLINRKTTKKSTENDISLNLHLIHKNFEKARDEVVKIENELKNKKI